MYAPKLKRLDLSQFEHLTEIPEFSSTPCLEVINLSSCRNLLDSGSSFQHLNSLHTLSLYACRKFRSFPKVAGNIQKLDLSRTAIEEVPSSIESLTKLSTLNLRVCAMFKHVSPNIFKLKSLRKLYLAGCSNLENFPEISEIMESLEELYLSDTAIKELPISIENLSGLLKLFLDYCKNLEMLPSSICNLRSLRYLNVSHCPKLNKLPENLGNLKSLYSLRATGTNICQLPSSLTFLEKLKELCCDESRGLTILPPMSGLLHSLTVLNLKDCNVIEIPQDIGCLSSLEVLDLRGNAFESLPKSIKQLSKLSLLYLSNCKMLQSLPELPLGLSQLETVNCKQLKSLPKASYFAELLIAGGSYSFLNCVMVNQEVIGNALKESLLLIQCQKGYEEEIDFQICFPGGDIPDWFNFINVGSSLNIKLPLHISGNRQLLGFVLCTTLMFDNFCPFMGVNYECQFETKYRDQFRFNGYLNRPKYGPFTINMDHVVIGYHDCSNYAQLSTDNSTICSIEFKPRGRCKIKHCGVHPIFVEPIIDKFGVTNQDFVETSGSGKRVCDDHEAEVIPNPKRICRE